MRTSDTSAVKSAARTLDLLDFFVQAQGPASFKAISRSLDIPASSLSQLLATLEARGFVEHVDRRGGYRRGPAFAALVVSLSRTGSLVERARPLLAELRTRLGESVGLNVLRGDLTEVVAAEHADGELTYRISVGTTAPLYAVAAGKALLAAMPDPEIEAYIARVRFAPLTSQTVRNGTQLWRDLRRVRTSGFAQSLGEASAGVNGVARVLFHQGLPVAALSVGMPAIRHDKAVEARIREGLLAAAEQFKALTEPAAPAC